MNEGKDNNRKKKIIICVVAVLVLLTALILFLYNRNKISATTMRILRLEGEVTLTDDGKDKPVKEELRLNSGNELSTAVKSLVSIGLDDVKIVTLDQLSRAQFNQDGRKLDLELTAGSLFFEVQQPLQDDETMDIRTSTMIVGIRGTSGWVSVDGEHEQLIVTDGVVHVTGRNPVTGEVKEIDVHAGERITVYLYNDRKVDSIEFILEKITERDLPEFVLERLRENRTLLDKVCRETGWDKPWILGEVADEIPKVVIDDNGPGGDDDNTPNGTSVAEEGDTEVEPVVSAADEERSTTGGATKEERAWAMSKVIATDPESKIMALVDGTLFDPVFYAVTNPDVVKKYGTDADSLLVHYLKYGKREGRPPIAPRTPTPTPTPTWVNPKPAQHVEEDDDHDDSGSSGGGGGGPSYPEVVNGVVSFNGATADYDTTTNPATFRITSSNGNTVTLPEKIKDGNNEIGVAGLNIQVDQSANNVTTIDASATNLGAEKALGLLGTNGPVTNVETKTLSFDNTNGVVDVNVKNVSGSRSEAVGPHVVGPSEYSNSVTYQGGLRLQHNAQAVPSQYATTLNNVNYINVKVDETSGVVTGDEGGTSHNLGTVSSDGVFTPNP